MTVRVLLADDHPVVRAGLAGMLDCVDRIEVVGDAADGEMAVVMARKLSPDVVLMDLRMPGMDGAAATRAIRDQIPGVNVLVLTTYDTDADILRAVEAGATGYLLKDTPRNDLIAGIEAAARGETVLSAPMAKKLSRGRDVDRPTARELQVLAQVALGRNNADIGRILGIGEATVKTHLQRVFCKLGVDDRTHAVTEALRRGLLG